MRNDKSRKEPRAYTIDIKRELEKEAGHGIEDILKRNQEDDGR